MIRKFRNEDLEQIMQLWLQANVQAHGFIEKTYWKSHYSEVRKMMPEAEIYVFDSEDGILGFLGLQEDYIAGIFVGEHNRGRGIGFSAPSRIATAFPCMYILKMNVPCGFMRRKDFI